MRKRNAGATSGVRRRAAYVKDNGLGVTIARSMLRALSLCIVVCFATFGATAAPSKQCWALSIDSRTTGQWLAIRGGVVYSVRDAHVIAIELATGLVHWTSAAKVEGRPAVGGRTIYAPISNGVVALDAATGRESGRLRLTATPELETSDFDAVAIVAFGGRSRLLGLRDTLQPRWQREFAHGWGRPEEIGHATVLVWRDQNSPDQSPVGSEPMGAYGLVAQGAGSGVVAMDARTGNAVAATNGVEDYVGRDNGTLWFSVTGGGLKSLDLDTNRSVAIHNNIVRGAVRVEGRTAIAVVDGHLTAISLPDGVQKRLHIDGRWVGGPADRTIFVSREDGTYAQRLSGGPPVRLVTNTSAARFLTSTGKSAYFATNDGSIIVADLDNVAFTTRLMTACRFVEGVRVVGRVALIHCDDARSSSHLYAFHLARSTR